MSIEEPAPVVSLDYFQQHNGPWPIVMRWAARIAIAYAVLVIASTFPMIFFYLLQPWGAKMRVVSTSIQVIALDVPSIACACLLLAGAVIVLRGRKSGRTMLIWSCAALIACGLIQFVFSYFFARMPVRSLPPGIFVYQFMASFFYILNKAFVPTVLIILFCRREMRDVLGNAP